MSKESKSLFSDLPKEIRDMLATAADALHDAAWVMSGAAPSSPLPPPVALVLPQTKRVEREIRKALRGN